MYYNLDVESKWICKIRMHWPADIHVLREILMSRSGDGVLTGVCLCVCVCAQVWPWPAPWWTSHSRCVWATRRSLEVWGAVSSSPPRSRPPASDRFIHLPHPSTPHPQRGGGARWDTELEHFCVWGGSWSLAPHPHPPACPHHWLTVTWHRGGVVCVEGQSRFSWKQTFPSVTPSPVRVGGPRLAARRGPGLRDCATLVPGLTSVIADSSQADRKWTCCSSCGHVLRYPLFSWCWPSRLQATACPVFLTHCWRPEPQLPDIPKHSRLSCRPPSALIG